MELINNYLKKTDFTSYEDFCEGFELTVPKGFDFARDIIDEWAKAEPDKLALVYVDDTGDDKYFTFSDISLLSKKAASYFLSKGIGKGDRVLTLLRRRYEYWICAVALHRIGAIVVPASIQLTTKDIAYRVNEAKVKAILAVNDDFVLEQIEGIGNICPSMEFISLIGGSNIPEYDDFSCEYLEYEPCETYSELTNDDAMLMYFTSGTSGYPKMAVHNRTYPLGHIMTAKYMQKVINGGLHLTQSDSCWAKFGWGNIYGQWICGSAILGYDPKRFNSVKLLNIIEKYRPTSICIPPTMYRFLLRDGLEGHHVKSVKWFSTAGEPLSGEVNKEFYEKTSQYIHEGFGQSETTPITCTFEWVDIRPASMGKPSPLYDVRIIDHEGNDCACGEAGEIVLKVGDKKQVGLLSFYSVDGKLEEPIQEGYYHTGDIAYRDDDGYFWYVSRNDDMIKCSGYRIGPFEIESILNTHEAVKESAIIGRPDEIRGQVVCAAISLRDGYTASEALTKELQEYVKSLTAPYKYPRIVEYVTELPKTTSGKIIRMALKKT